MSKAETDLEKHVQQLARGFPYPNTPKPARQVRRAPHIPQLARGWLLIALLLASLIAAPPVRATLAEFLQIGAIRIFFNEETPPAPTVEATPLEAAEVRPTASSAPTDALPAFGLDGETALEELRQKVDFPILLPSYPADLGPPDKVFHQYLDGGEGVFLAWLDDENPDEIGLSLWLLTPGVYVSKGSPEDLLETSLHGGQAIWLEGVHRLLLQASPSPINRFVTRNVLIWEMGAITYRLEGDFSLEEATRIAESVR